MCTCMYVYMYEAWRSAGQNIFAVCDGIRVHQRPHGHLGWLEKDRERFARREAVSAHRGRGGGVEGQGSPTGARVGTTGRGNWHRLVVHRGGHTFIGVVCVFRMFKLDLIIRKIQTVEHSGKQLVWAFKSVTVSGTKRRDDWEPCVVLDYNLERKRK